MKRLILAFFLAFSTAFLAGCPSMGILVQQDDAKPLTFDQRLKVAQKQATGVLAACTALVDAGRMDADEARQCMAFVDEAKAAIDATRGMTGGDQMAQLMAIQQALLRVEAFLQSRQA